MNATEQQRGRSRHRPNSAFDVMALAASAGGLKARSYLLTGLPTDFPASVLVVQRLCHDQPSLLADILSRRTALMAKQTVDGDVLPTANVFTPVPDRHPLVRPDGTVSQAPRVQFVRPLYDSAFALGTLPGALGGW
ncbi:MAG TPA: chemotaxis protein CheB [Gemmataceae bacterium]|nr:chemotaxis protein CheB [Gemmataceae bacterium]